MPRGQVRERYQVAGILGIGRFSTKPVSSLSGGDHQRVALGRAIVEIPRPFSWTSLLARFDAAIPQRICRIPRNFPGLHDRMGATTVYVTA